MKYFWLNFTKYDMFIILISGLIGMILMFLTTIIGNSILIEIRFNLIFSAVKIFIL